MLFNVFFSNLSSSYYISGFPAFHYGQVAVQSNGFFQAASALALEEHHIPQEKQGGRIFTSQKRIVC